MKVYPVITGLAIAGLILSNCHTARKTAVTPKQTYESGISTVIAANCSPCHFPSKGGNKKPFDTYANAKANIDDMIRRIELNPTDRGFMPFKRAKLSDSTIAVFRQWRTDGLEEK